MPRYTVNWDYGSSLGAWKEGDIADLDADIADHVNRSSPGVLTPVNEQPEQEPEDESEETEPEDDEPETRAIEEPPHDRMVRKPANKRGGAS